MKRFQSPVRLIITATHIALICYRPIFSLVTEYDEVRQEREQREKCNSTARDPDPL